MAANADDYWKNADIEYSVNKVADGTYTTEQKNPMIVESVTDVEGKLLVEGVDYKVLYFNDADGKGPIADGDSVVSVGQALTGNAAEVPYAIGNYFVVVVPMEAYEAVLETYPTVADWEWYDGFAALGYNAISFKVVPNSNSVEGAYAFEGGAVATDEELADREFVYNGGYLPVNFAVGDDVLDTALAGTGSGPDPAADAAVVWTSVPENAEEPAIGTDEDGEPCWLVKDAGTYKAKVTGVSADWSGEYETTFTVRAIDLAADAPYIAVSTDDEPMKLWPAGNISKTYVSILGTSMTEDAEFAIELIAYNDDKNSFKLPTGSNHFEMKVLGKYTFRLTAFEGSDNVTGATTVDAYVVGEEVSYKYNGALLNDIETLNPAFDAAKGTTFTKNAITATVGSNVDVKDETSITVVKDGVEVEEFAAPGVYEVTLDTPVAPNNAYAGHTTFKFTVLGKDYSGSIAYAFVDGKHLADGARVEYDGQAVEPTVVVKDAKGNTLAEGADYTVELRDAATDEALESAVEVGSYEIAVVFNGEFGGKLNGEDVIPFEIVQANVQSAEATEPYFALPSDGSAATPDFTLYTQLELKGNAFPISDVETAVTYYKATWHDGAIDGKKDGEVQFGELSWNDPDNVVRAEDLTEAGYYVADINVLVSSKNFKGGADAWFALTDKVSYDDVDANAWYAAEVYKATENGYVQGVGDKLFFPEAEMTRAQFAQVLFNMSGAIEEEGSHPTQFSDVESTAWYAKAVSWAVEAGVVNGVSDTEFEPEGKITREQIATMLYRYAGNGAQADLAVLDQFADAGSVSDWAETAMAWAVEEGHMNGRGGDGLQPQGNATRAEVAALSVRVQPEPLEKPIV